MTYPIHPGASFWAAQTGEKPSNTLFGRTTSFCTDVYCLLFNSSSIMTPWGKQSNSWTLWLFFLDQGFPVEYGLFLCVSIRHTQEQLYVSPKLAMSTAMQNPASTSTSYFTSRQHFLETCTLLPETTRATKLRWLQHLFPQTANITFATYGEHISLIHPTMP